MASVRPPTRSSQVAVTSLLFLAQVTEQEELHEYLNHLDLEALLPTAIPFHAT